MPNTRGAQVNRQRPAQFTAIAESASDTGPQYYLCGGLRYKQNQDGKVWRWSATENDWVRSTKSAAELKHYSHQPQ